MTPAGGTAQVPFTTETVMLARTRTLTRLASVALVVGIVGCAPSARPTSAPAPDTPAGPSAPADEVGREREKLAPADRALVDAQEWCVISTDERLGSMGPPLKLSIKGQPVFVCCKGCVRKAEADPDKTLATAAELKAKRAKAGSP